MLKCESGAPGDLSRKTCVSEAAKAEAFHGGLWRYWVPSSRACMMVAVTACMMVALTACLQLRAFEEHSYA